MSYNMVAFMTPIRPSTRAEPCAPKAEEEFTIPYQGKISRRQFLQRTSQSLGGLLITSALTSAGFAAERKRLKVAAIITAFTYRSHAQVILENFVHPYLFNGKWISSGMDVVSMY